MANENPMTELPDGSGCFTATILSHEEAMKLPLKERPLNHRISSEMYHAVFEAVGEASMCWSPSPATEVFDSNKASDVAVRLCFKIADEMERRASQQPAPSDVLTSPAEMHMLHNLTSTLQLALVKLGAPQETLEAQADGDIEHINYWIGKLPDPLPLIQASEEAGRELEQQGAGPMLTAERIPDRPGWVRSPYAPDSEPVDCNGFAPGQEVHDPTTQKIFLVPALPIFDVERTHNGAVVGFGAFAAMNEAEALANAAKLFPEHPEDTYRIVPAALPPAQIVLSPGETVKHQRTGGYYEIITPARMEADLTEVYVYRSKSIGNPGVWVRPAAEMVDGRFERLDHQQVAAITAPIPLSDRPPVPAAGHLDPIVPRHPRQGPAPDSE